MTDEISASPATGNGAHQRALTEISLSILRSEIGQRIATSLQFQERLEVGSGTVQKAIRQLIDTGAVKLRVKGHLGTVIEEFDPALLWKAADVGPVRLTLTPPGGIESTGIALGVRAQLADHHVATEFDFVRGASKRVATLEQDAPRVVVVSKVAAEGFGLIRDSRFASLDLGPLTYYRPETLAVLRSPQVTTETVRRVARDPDSYDHDHLTRAEFPEASGYEYVDCAFPDVPASILAGHADAGVWHRVVTVITPEQAGLISSPLQRLPRPPDDLGAISNALLVWRSEFGEINSLLGLLIPNDIRAWQDELVSKGIGSPEVRDVVPWL